MKKVVVISTSLRPGSNSHLLAEQFAAFPLATIPGAVISYPLWGYFCLNN